MTSWLRLVTLTQHFLLGIQIASVAEALIRKYSCLKEPGYFTGYYGWQMSLKYKMADYRR